MIHALDYLQGLSGIQRAQIALSAGVTPSYVARLLCSRQKKDYAPLHLVIECSRHSEGKIDILGSIRPSGVDWAYLRDYLNKAL